MKKPVTFVEFAELAIADAETRVLTGRAASTLVRDYRNRLENHVRPYFRNAKASAVDGPMLRLFQRHLADKGLSASSILTVMSFVSVVLKLADEHDALKRMPPIPRLDHRAHPRPSFSREQYQRLLTFLRAVERGKKGPVVARGGAVDGELRQFVTFAVNSFLRPGDLVELRHEHIDIVEPADGPRYLRLNLPPSKNHPDPVITMPMAVPIYRRILERQRKAGFGAPDDYVFVPERRNRETAHTLLRRRFAAVLKAMNMETDVSGEPFTLYSLRHTAITFRLLQARDLDLLTLARNCRTSVEMIDRFYASRLSPEMNRDKLHSFRRETRYAA